MDVTGESQCLYSHSWQDLNIPLTQTLTPRVYFDNQVPIKTSIPVKETLKVNRDLPIDTKVQVKVLGKDITLPLKGTIPIKLDVPIDIQFRLSKMCILNLMPIYVQFENLNIPLDTTLKTNIPINGHLNVPIETALAASVDIAKCFCRLKSDRAS